MSLTDEIYDELLEGLTKSLDWQEFLAKHGNSKGPLYNAIGRFFTEAGGRIAALKEQESSAQDKLQKAGLTLESLNQKIREAENNIASLEDKTKTLNEKNKTLEDKLVKKSELSGHLEEIERLGFDSERIRRLHDVITEIGKKHGLEGPEALNQFFEALKDYDLDLGAELRLNRLQTQIESKELEAENWQAKEEALRRKYSDLKETIDAVRALRAKNIQDSQIITWRQILTRVQTIEQFGEELAKYANMTELLNSKKEEIESNESNLAKLQSQVETMQKEKVKIGSAIESLKMAGVEKLATLTEEATKQLKIVANRGIEETRSISEDVMGELISFLAQLDTLAKKIFNIGQDFERTKQKLQKYDGLKDVLEAHAESDSENGLPKRH